MCDSPIVLGKLKDEFDLKFKRTGVRSTPRMFGSIGDSNSLAEFIKSRGIPTEYYNVFVSSCGQCRSCRLQKSKEKAMQVYGEVYVNSEDYISWRNYNGCDVHNNCFITLTFGYEQCLWYLQNVRKFSYYKARRYASFLCWSLEKREYVLFQKRLRRLFNSTRIRFFHCGEYGEKYNRPHHHAIILGFDFPDKYLWNVQDGVKYYRSSTLEKLWPFGFSLISEVTYNSCAYVARYVTKKITGKQADNYYNGREPEYCTQSNRPGIGYNYFEKYGLDSVYNTDTMTTLNYKGKKVKSRPPKYFDDLLQRTNPTLYNSVKSQREKNVIDNIDKIFEDNLASRCLSRAELTDVKLKRLVRSFEVGMDITQDEFYKKGNAFGISQEMLDSSRPDWEKWLNMRTSKEYYFKSSNQDSIDFNRRLSQDLKKYCTKDGVFDKVKYNDLYYRYRKKLRRGKILSPLYLKYNI